MAVKMRVSSPVVHMKVDKARVVYLGGELYTGDCTVIPSAASEHTLKTANKLMPSDVTVKKIPYYEMDNNVGGVTVYIGSDSELNIE